MSATARVELRRLVEDAVLLARPGLGRAAARRLASDAIADAARVGGLSVEAITRTALARAEDPVMPGDVVVGLSEGGLRWGADAVSGRLRVDRPRSRRAVAGTEAVAEDAPSAAGRRGVGPASLGAAVGIALAVTLGAGQRQATAPAPPRPASVAVVAVGDGGPVVPTGPVAGERGGQVPVAARRVRRRHVEKRAAQAARPVVVKAGAVKAVAPQAAAPTQRTSAPAPIRTTTPAPAPQTTSAPKAKPAPTTKRPSSSETWATDFTP
jgi:hypothetical protein